MNWAKVEIDAVEALPWDQFPSNCHYDFENKATGSPKAKGKN
jgi:hypothetical protein